MARAKRPRERRRRGPRAKPPQLNERAAGILLHPTSLPGPHGSGDFGPAAYRFVDFLKAAGQRWWQVLPLRPIGYGNSPYSTSSSFAGGSHLINLELLVQDGLLHTGELEPTGDLEACRVNYAAVLSFRTSRLRKAFDAFRGRRRGRASYERFREHHRAWLEDYALYSALKRTHDLRPWVDWETELALRKPAALRRARQALREDIEYECFLQYAFDRQWSQLKRYCNEHGVGLIGDLPIFANHDSCDVWANQSLYHLDRGGRPTVVSGVPPDYFSDTGQLWGHPLYRWERHARTGYAWWVRRLGHMLSHFDAIRIDHFLGFNRLWNVPARAKTAIRGRWTRSPGDEIFAAAEKALGALPIIAEDLGLLIREAAELRMRWGFPGMRILQFGFEEGIAYDQPHRYPRNCVAYTGTHDNNTTVGWFRSLPRRGPKDAEGLNERQRTLRYIHGSGKQIHWGFIRVVYASVANIAIIPMQDALGLGEEARMNYPSTTEGNWEWRMPAAALNDAQAGRLLELADTYERTTGLVPEQAIARV
jgi:4-alpha-glucanotransferase